MTSNVFVLNADSIRELMERRNMTVADLATTVNMTEAELQDVLDGRAMMSTQLEDVLLLQGAFPVPAQPAVEVIPVEELEPVQDEPAVPADATNVRRISNSEIQTFKRCRRKWWLAWHRGLRLKDESPVGVKNIGNRIHRAFEVAYAPGGPYLDILTAAHERVIAHDSELVAGLDEVTQAQFIAEVDLERIMIEGYIQWLEETGADANLEVLGSEVYTEAPLELLFPGLWPDPVHIIGRLDVVVRVKSTGALMFLDHKTVGNITQPLMLLPTNEQMRHYTLLHWMLNPDERVEGAIFNMLRRVKRSGRAKPPFYHREETRYNRHVIESYYDRLREEVDHLLELQHRMNVLGVDHPDVKAVAYPSPNGQCTWDCPFVKICPMFDDGSRVEDAIAAQYEVVDPLSYYDRDKEEGANEE